MEVKRVDLIISILMYLIWIESIRFYEKALGLRKYAGWKLRMVLLFLVYMGEEKTGFLLELTWLRDRKEPYDLGEGSFISVCVFLGTMMPFGPITNRWIVCARRTRIWDFILSMIRMVIG